MTESDKGAFAALLTDALAYWRQDVSAFTLRVWWDGCRSFDLEQVGKALSAHAADPERGQFPPTLADVVKALKGTQTDRSLVAWGKVLGAISSAGSYASVAFDDTAIHDAILDLGGWPAVCQSSEDELQHLQRRFCASHRTHSARAVPSVPYLVGIAEATNRGNGKPVSPPRLIGNKDLAVDLMMAAMEGRQGDRIASGVEQALQRIGMRAKP
jgi:hypothetical protein